MRKLVAAGLFSLTLLVGGTGANATCTQSRSCETYTWRQGWGQSCEYCTKHVCFVVTGNCEEFAIEYDPICRECYWEV